MQDEDRYENGHSYSGGIGMLRGVENSKKVFDTQKEAFEYINNNAEKWEPALAVQFKSPKGELYWYIGGICES